MTNSKTIYLNQNWLGLLQPVGLVVAAAALEQAPNRGEALEAQNDLRALIAEAEGDGDQPERKLAFEAFVRGILGWSDAMLDKAPQGFDVPVPEYSETLRPSYAVTRRGHDAPLLLIRDLGLGRQFDTRGKATAASGPRWNASPQVKFERLLKDNGVPLGLLWNGRALRLVYAPSGETSGHLTFPLDVMSDTGGRDVLGALQMLLNRKPLLRGRLHKAVEDSRAYQALVSNRLADQVLEAFITLLRGFQDADATPPEIYAGLLTVLLRLVFLLYAEDQGLMPGDDIYVASYSVTGLFERLRDDADLYHDTMDQRFGAYAQLISLFDMVHDGSSGTTVHLPARHGELFDPDEHPFLSGRKAGVRRVLGQRFDPPRVSDGVIYRVLDKLLMLDGERLSYRALDVEQIGSVYESMMGYEVERATGEAIAVGKDHVFIDLTELLQQPPAKRARFVQDATGYKPSAGVRRALKAAEATADLVDALHTQLSLRTPTPLPPRSLYLQPSDERRRTGSHYTPRELTGPIVQRTLDPVLEDLGSKPTPDQILALKVCDPAMGSGAFLVEACRQLGDALLAAWNTHDALPHNLPPDLDPVLYARRVVAQTCIYGVDKNPFAVSLAKLSLWLVTLAKDHPFTFVDHALKCGDSLVGLTRQQIRRFEYNPLPRQTEGLPLFDFIHKQAELRQNISLYGDDDARKRSVLREAEDITEPLRWRGDLILAAFFNESKSKARDKLRLTFWNKVRMSEHENRTPDMDGVVAEFRAKLRPFHWEIEFPEVFLRSNPGFDAIVGNPPFAGKNTIIGGNIAGYVDWLKTQHEGSNGNADLVAHFFRRAFVLSRQDRNLGLIATNTVAQGDTRESGLVWICKNGGDIYFANKRLKWPGLAAVVVSVIHIKRGKASTHTLDGKDVDKITAFLFYDGGHDRPHVLNANSGQSFQGSIVLGMGFTFDDTDRKGVASTLADMEALITKDSRNAERIFPYIGGSEVNSSPTHSHHRYVINFGQMDEEEARLWPDLMAVIEEKVKPARLAQKREIRKRYWWRFGEVCPALYAAIQDLDRVLVIARVSQHACLTFLAKRMVYSEQLIVFPLQTNAAFAALQSRTHEVWARFFASSMKDDLRYTPTDCFETFPFPENWTEHPALEAAGEAYYTYRAELMVENDEGMTTTYNRFHDPKESDPKIERLRELHAEMDRAVLDAYGWNDLEPECDFYLDYPIDEATWSSRKKKPYRYRWPDEFHDQVLGRLIELNGERAAAEAKAKRAGKKKRKT